jgi:hypothetical protein
MASPPKTSVTTSSTPSWHPESGRQSSRTVTGTSADGRPVASQLIAAGAPSDAPGTLIEVPLIECLDPGESVRAELEFQLVLGANADERIGHSPGTQTAWLGSGFPLLPAITVTAPFRGASSVCWGNR